MKCQVIDCSGTAVAVVIQTRHCAWPGAEHYACRECARESRSNDLRVVEIHDDSIQWSDPGDPPSGS